MLCIYGFYYAAGFTATWAAMQLSVAPVGLQFTVRHLLLSSPP